MTPKEAKEYNSNQYSIWNVEGYGCIGQLACESCGEIYSGTCLCSGIFDCPKCGEKDAANNKINFDDLYISPEVLEEIKSWRPHE